VLWSRLGQLPPAVDMTLDRMLVEFTIQDLPDRLSTCSRHDARPNVGDSADQGDTAALKASLSAVCIHSS
jgi:hypothetical protein